MTDQITPRGFKGGDTRPANCEKLPFTAWELAAIENALRYYGNHHASLLAPSGSDLARRQLLNLADRISDANPV